MIETRVQRGGFAFRLPAAELVFDPASASVETFADRQSRRVRPRLATSLRNAPLAAGGGKCNASAIAGNDDPTILVALFAGSHGIGMGLIWPPELLREGLAVTRLSNGPIGLGGPQRGQDHQARNDDGC